MTNDNTPNINEVLERMAAEYDALVEKINKLKTFLTSDDKDEIAPDAVRLLTAQYDHMRGYAKALRERYILTVQELEEEKEGLSPNEQLSAYEDAVAVAIKDIPTPDGTELHTVSIKLKRVPASDEEDLKDALDKLGFAVLDFRELF